MTNLGKLWDLEKGLWNGTREHFESTLSRECVMVLPDPIGILLRDAVIEGLALASSWDSVEFSQQVDSEISGDTVTLAYCAKAIRADNPPYLAYCSSTYYKIAEQWKLIPHQHTPIENWT